MKQTSKDKIINQSLADKLSLARDLKRQERYCEAIEAYRKVLFLREDGQYMLELAEIYERNCDIASAVLFYRRANQLTPNSTAHEKVKFLSKVQGLQLLALGSVKNILADSEFEAFVNRYPTFHRRMQKKLEEKRTVADYLESCLAYLEVNQRQLALSEVDNCIMLDQTDADLMVLRAMILWSLLEIPRGYEQFWAAFRLDRSNPEVVAFLQMISPEMEKLYRQAKYHLIEGKEEKCRLKVKRGLEIHPFHTQFLILSAYLHRKREEYEQALADLELANKHLEDRTLEEELRSQISLTYNEMGIFLYRQKKYTEALTLFSEGLAFKGGDWGMLTNRGDCHRETSNFVKALEDYLAAYEIEKKNDELNLRISSIYSIRGVALFNSKNYDLALKEFEESTRYSPKEAQFYLSKAKCLLQLSRKSQAIEQLEKCVALNPNNAEAVQMLQQVRDPQERTKGKNGRKVIVLSKEK